MEILAREMTQVSAARRAQTPFKFHTSFVLQQATGLRAGTLPQLLALLRKVPESCIYHHTHYFLRSHHYLIPEPANDFSYWVAEVLGDERLGELLAGVDVMEHASLESLRNAFVHTLEAYLQHNPAAHVRFVGEGEEFFFIQSLNVIMPTPYQAADLAEFAEALRRVSIHSLYFHVFDARLRVGRPSNDFAVWLDEQLGEQALAQQFAQLDPYARTLEALRRSLLSLLEEQLGKRQAVDAPA